MLRRRCACRSPGTKGHVAPSPQPREVPPPGSHFVPLLSPHGSLFTPRLTPLSSGWDVLPLRGVLQPWGGGGTGSPSHRVPQAGWRSPGEPGGWWLLPCGWKGVTPWGVNALPLGVPAPGGSLPERDLPAGSGRSWSFTGTLRRGGWFPHPPPASPARLQPRGLSFGKASAITSYPRTVSFRSLIPAHQGGKTSNLRPLWR